MQESFERILDIREIKEFHTEQFEIEKFIHPSIFDIIKNSDAHYKKIEKIYNLFQEKINNEFKYGQYGKKIKKIKDEDGQIIILYLIQYFKIIFDQIYNHSLVFNLDESKLSNLINWIRYIHVIILTLIRNDTYFSKLNLNRHYTLMIISITHKIIWDFKTLSKEIQTKSSHQYCTLWNCPSYLLSDEDIQITKDTMDNLTDFLPQLADKKQAFSPDKKYTFDLKEWEDLMQKYPDYKKFTFEPSSKIKIKYLYSLGDQVYDYNKFGSYTSNSKIVHYMMREEKDEQNYIKQFLIILMTLFPLTQTRNFYIYRFSLNPNDKFQVNVVEECDKDYFFGHDKFFIPWDLLKHKKYNLINSYEHNWDIDSLSYLKHAYHAKIVDDNSTIVSHVFDSKNYIKKGIQNYLPIQNQHIKLSKDMSKYRLNSHVLEKLRTDFIILIVIVKYHFNTIFDKQSIIQTLKHRRENEKYKLFCDILLLCLGENIENFSKIYSEINKQKQKQDIQIYLMFLFMFRYTHGRTWDLTILGTNLDNIIRKAIGRINGKFKNAKIQIFSDKLQFEINKINYKYIFLDKSQFIYQKIEETHNYIVEDHPDYPKLFIYNDKDKHIQKYDNPSYLLQKKGTQIILKKDWFDETHKINTLYNKLLELKDIYDPDIKINPFLWKNQENKYVIEFPNFELEFKYEDEKIMYKEYELFSENKFQIINRWVDKLKNCILLKKNNKYFILLFSIKNIGNFYTEMKKGKGKYDQTQNYKLSQHYDLDNKLSRQIDNEQTDPSSSYDDEFKQKAYAKSNDTILWFLNDLIPSPEIFKTNKYYILSIDNLGLNINGTDEEMLAYYYSCASFGNHEVFDIVIDNVKINNKLKLILLNFSEEDNLDYLDYFIHKIFPGKIERKHESKNTLYSFSTDYKFQDKLTFQLTDLHQDPSDYFKKLYTKKEIDGISLCDPAEYTLNQNEIKSYTNKLNEYFNELNTSYIEFFQKKKMIYIDWILSNLTKIYNIIYLGSCIKIFDELAQGNKTCNELLEYSKFIEINNLANGTRTKYLALFEIQFGNIIRQEQYDIIYDNAIIQDIEGKKEKKVYQMLMGKGKTSVIAPLLAFHHLFENIKNIIVVMPSHLLESSKSIFSKYSFLMKDINLFKYTTDRYTGDIGTLDNRLFKTENKHIMLTDHNIQIFLLNDVETYQINYPLDNTLIIIDEIDTLSNPLTSDVNFPEGEEIQLNKEYLDFLIKILFLESKKVDFNEYLKSMTYVDNLFQKINPSYFKDVWEVFMTIMEKSNYENIPDDLVEKQIKQLSVLRKIRHTLIDCFMLVYKKDYGFGSKDKMYPEQNGYIAVPYSAVDTPSNGSEFSDMYITNILTILIYKYDGLDEDNLIQIYNKYYLKISKIEYIKLNYIYPIFQNYGNLLNLIRTSTTLNKDILTHEEIKNIGHDKTIILDFLNNFVLNTYIRTTRKQLNSSFLDILPDTFCRYRTGFSGTTNMLLPKYITDSETNFTKLDEENIKPRVCISRLIKIKQMINDKNIKVNIKIDNEFHEIWTNKDQKTDSDIQNIEFAIKKHYDTEIISNKVFKFKMSAKLQNIKINNNTVSKFLESYSALIDTGALFKDYKSKEIAEYLGKIGKKIIYLDENSDKKIYYDGVHKPFRDEIDNIFIYYDHKHTIGVDIKQPSKMKGLVTISYFNRLTDVSQGMYRLRKLNKGHYVNFVVDESINVEGVNEIYTLLKEKNEDYLSSMRYKFKIQNLRTILRTLEKKKLDTTNIPDKIKSIQEQQDVEQKQKLILELKTSMTEYYNQFIVETIDIEKTTDLTQIEATNNWNFFVEKLCKPKQTNQLIKYLCAYLCYYLYRSYKKQTKTSPSKMMSKSTTKFVEIDFEISVSKEKIIDNTHPFLKITQDSYNLDNYLDFKFEYTFERLDDKSNKIQKSNTDILKKHNVYLSPGWIWFIQKIRIELHSVYKFIVKQEKAHKSEEIDRFKNYDIHNFKNSIILKKNGKYLICTNQERFILKDKEMEEIQIYSDTNHISVQICKLFTFNITTIMDIYCLRNFIKDDTSKNDVKNIIELMNLIYNIELPYGENLYEKMDDESILKNIIGLPELPEQLNNMIQEEMKNMKMYDNISLKKQCITQIDRNKKYFKDDLTEYKYLVITDSINTTGLTKTNIKFEHEGNKYEIYESSEDLDIFNYPNTAYYNPE